MTTWKDHLTIPDDLAHQIDLFESQMELRRQGKIDEKVFAETRLRRGAYGQRYDNGQRHDGEQTRTLIFPLSDTTKGPDTLWDAPGMMRLKIPYGGLNPEQLEVLAETADEYADGILHVTTRQDIQLHYIHLDDTPDLMRRLAAVGITTQEACGNSVRNVTACPLAGVCHSQAFDVTPYADAMAQYFLGHDDVQDFGRKLKIAFSGCEHEACGLTMLHDLGLLAQTRRENGQPVRGFRVYVGGGLGTVPYQAKVLADFVREEEMLPLSQAIFRVFARLGEKRNRNRARLKFLVAQLGIEEFRRLVYTELETIPPDEQWTGYLQTVAEYGETPLKPALPLNGMVKPDGFDEWFSTNVYQQRQVGYTAVTINTPLGDFTSEQAFHLADIARRYVGDT
ncbi:MAG: nitrite/sulfite reductase, partial [Anaerolineae bacterium]|nr:nitrite/sulfite reductase [Anaerolineae bacterium]